MVKIIRLSTDETDGSFNTRFRAPVNIKPYSRIALQNLVMGVNLKELVVNASNNVINYQVSSAVRTCNLTRKTYTDNDARDIIDDIQFQMNGALVFQNGKELGAQFKVSQASRITIQNNFSASSSYTPQFSGNIPKNTGGDAVVDMSSPTAKAFIMNRASGLAGGVASTNNQAINFLDQTICKGTGLFRFKIHTLVDEASDNLSGFVIGLCKGEVSGILKGVSDAGTFTDDDIYFGIRVNKLATNMQLISEGQSIATAHSPNSLGMYVGANNGNNAICEIKVSGNQMEAMIYYNGGQQSLGTKSVNLDGSDMKIQSQVYTPFVIYRGSDVHVKTKNHVFIQDPFTPFPKDFAEGHETELGVPNPPTQQGGGASRLTNQFIEIVDPTFARQLGFVPNRNPVSGTVSVQRLVFTASQDFSLIALNDNFMALIDNVYLDSYDSLIGGHRPILSVIPSADDIGVIRFDSKFPVFVDCNNREGISLKNIKLRVIRQDGSAVVSQGLSTATLLIDEK